MRVIILSEEIMDLEKLGKKIKDIRVSHNLTQTEFAQFFYVSPQAVSKWEVGKSMPDLETLYLISEKFNINFSEFLEDDIINFKPSKKIRNIKICLFISLIVTIMLGLMILVTHKDDFEFRTISSNVNNFSLYGSIAYNENKATIYISHITYEGEDSNNEYVNIKCLLYENVGNKKEVIGTYNYEDKEIKLKDFLSKVNFNINHYSDNCKVYNNDSLHLEIEAINASHQTVFYKIPLIIENSCEN